MGRRRFGVAMAVAISAGAGTVLGPVNVGAQMPPPAPVGGEDLPDEPPPVPPALPHNPTREAQGQADISTQAALTAQPATRAFGTQPYQDTTAAATTEATRRRAAGCGLSNARLAGMMLAITFTEAGPLASTTTAPSPMTLSRWDTQSILYSFGSASTRYPRAFWHPGVGLWQFDHPWRNTAAGRIDTRHAAVLAAQVVASRWCGWSSSTGLTRFQYTVRPWHGCNDETGAGNRCLAIFNHHFRANAASLADDALVGFTLQSGVTRLGGARYTSCLLAREASTRSCMYVNPGAAQGSRAWAATTGLPTPLAAPFYVITVGDREWRYWLRADTGYDRDIVASAVLGSNPRATLAWRTGAGLCDVGAGRGSCSGGAAQGPLSGAELSSPALTSFDGSRLDLFTRASGGALAHSYRLPGGSWTRTPSLGGALRSQPAAVSWSPGRLDVFARGADDALWHRAYGAGRWSPWESLGGALSSAPTVASRDAGRLEVFARGANNALWFRAYVSGRGWSGWQSLGGGLASSPAAVSSGPARLDVFVKGPGDAAYQRSHSTTGGWSPWVRLGGALTSAPATASSGVGLVDVVVRGRDGAFWLTRRTDGGGPVGWTDLGGQFTSGPGATAVSEAMWISGRAPTGSLYEAVRDSSSAPWSGWRRMGL